MKDTDKLNIVHFGGESKEVIEAEDRWHDEQMNNTEKILRDEWSQGVDEEMPMMFIVDGEKEIADWRINKITQALVEEERKKQCTCNITTQKECPIKGHKELVNQLLSSLKDTKSSEKTEEIK